MMNNIDDKHKIENLLIKAYFENFEEKYDIMGSSFRSATDY